MKMKATLAALMFCITGFVARAQEPGSEQDNQEVTTTTITTTETTTTVKQKGSKDEENIPTVSHTVQMGETVMLICKKYIVSPDDIYKLNPQAVDGISPGMVLLVPAEKKVETTAARTKPVDTSITSRNSKSSEQ